MREAPQFRHRPSGPNRPHRGPAKVIRLPAAKPARRRRAIRTGFGILILSLFGAILARLYLSRGAASAPVATAPGKITQPVDPAATPRVANAS